MERAFAKSSFQEQWATSSQAPKFSAALIKVASRCNLDCDYCYVYKHADQSWKDLPRFMSDETIAQFASRLKAYLVENGSTEFSVTFHGGEPLLFGARRLRAAAEKIRATIAMAAKIDFSLQTNGVLLDEQSLEELILGKIGVSVSLDGPRRSNDLHRLNHAGGSTFDDVKNAIELLKRSPADIFRGVIAVIDLTSSPRDLLAFFSDLDVPRLDLLLPDSTHIRPPPGRLQNGSLYSEWLKEAFRVWYQEYSHIPIRWFDAILASRAGLPSPTDAMGLGAVCLVVIDTDGTYSDHDVFKITRDGAPSLGSTLATTSLSEAASHPTFLAHNSRLQHEGLAAECQTCPAVEACGGGSVMHRWHPSRGLDAPTVYCAEMFSLLEEATILLRESMRDVSTAAANPVPYLQEKQGFVEQCRIWRLHTDQRASLLRIDSESANQESAAAVLLDYLNSARREKTEAQPRISYLRLWLGNIRVQSDDRRLVEPFKDSIRLLHPNSVQVAHGLRSLEAAASLLRVHGEFLLCAFAELITDVLFVESTIDAEGGIFSFSDDRAPNVLYIAPYAGGLPLPPEDIADSLLHEFLHQTLYHIEEDGIMLFDKVYPRFPAPWCNGLRPSGGFLHGTYVFTGLSLFWQSLAATTTDEKLLKKASQNRDLFAKNAAYGIRSLKQFALLTERGRLLLSCLEENLGIDADERMKAPGILL